LRNRVAWVILREYGAMLQLAKTMGFVNDGSEPMDWNMRPMVLAPSKA
jgi:hypothetical protein